MINISQEVRKKHPRAFHPDKKSDFQLSVKTISCCGLFRPYPALFRPPRLVPLGPVRFAYDTPLERKFPLSLRLRTPRRHHLARIQDRTDKQRTSKVPSFCLPASFWRWLSPQPSLTRVGAWLFETDPIQGSAREQPSSSSSKDGIPSLRRLSVGIKISSLS